MMTSRWGRGFPIILSSIPLSTRQRSMHNIDHVPVVYSSKEMRARLDRVNIIGVGVHPLRFSAAIDLLERWIAEGLPRIVVFPGSDSLAACNDHPDYRKILNTA